LIDLSQAAPQPKTWKLTLAYDGTGFSGWQIQPGELTVQGELQSALRRVTGESPLPQGSGRTDAGVHALGQVASFDLEANIPPENLVRALNRILPAAIRILEARTVPSTFHARHSAIAKTYEYRVFRETVCPPFLARYVHACSWPLDVEVLQQSARLFEGEHDFLSFSATDPDLATRNASSGQKIVAEPGQAVYRNPAQETNLSAPTEPAGKQGTTRTIFSSNWERRKSESGCLLVYRVRGNGFGTMLDVSRGHLEIDKIPAILAARSRSAAGPTAPAQGLFLHSVEYERKFGMGTE
jgi:tRNA pseudouridine38-40 synthase